MFTLSALLAIVGAAGYQFFVKRISPEINPVISVIGIYLAVLIMSGIMLPFFPIEGGLRNQLKQLNWVQLAVAGSVLLVELGYLLMYRSAWNLGTANIVTGVFINLTLVALGTLLLGDKISTLNAAGIIISIIGVALISYRGLGLPFRDESLNFWIDRKKSR